MNKRAIVQEVMKRAKADPEFRRRLVTRIKKAKINKDTPIIPSIVADQVIQEVTAWFFHGSGDDDPAEDIWKIKKKLVKDLVKQAEADYKSKPAFAKKLNGAGNKGRDFLYTFMRRNLAATLKKTHRDIFNKLPPTFAKGEKIRGKYKFGSVEKQAKFPPKAVDFNRLSDTDGFWGADVKDISKAGGVRPLSNPKKVSEVIFWLNMVAMAWEDQQK